MEIDKNSFQFIFASTIKALIKHSAIEYDIRGIAISPEQSYILKILDTKDDSIQSDLAGIMQIDKSAVMRHIDQLESKGMVQRVNDAIDRRKKYIVITDLGNEELKKCEAAQKFTTEKIMQGITDNEMSTFKQVLNKLKDNAEN
jgi:DNA-binding MarR family transcriptional regulator